MNPHVDTERVEGDGESIRTLLCERRQRRSPDTQSDVRLLRPRARGQSIAGVLEESSRRLADRGRREAIGRSRSAGRTRSLQRQPDPRFDPSCLKVESSTTSSTAPEIRGLYQLRTKPGGSRWLPLLLASPVIATSTIAHPTLRRGCAVLPRCRVHADIPISSSTTKARSAASTSTQSGRLDPRTACFNDPCSAERFTGSRRSSSFPCSMRFNPRRSSIRRVSAAAAPSHYGHARSPASPIRGQFAPDRASSNLSIENPEYFNRLTFAQASRRFREQRRGAGQGRCLSVAQQIMEVLSDFGARPQSTTA